VRISKATEITLSLGTILILIQLVFGVLIWFGVLTPPGLQKQDCDAIHCPEMKLLLTGFVTQDQLGEYCTKEYTDLHIQHLYELQGLHTEQLKAIRQGQIDQLLKVTELMSR